MVRDGILVGRSLRVELIVVLNKHTFPLIRLSPHTKYHPNRMENSEVEILAVGQFWLVRLVGQKIVVGISYSIYLIFSPLLAPIPNFIQIGLILVGQVGRL